MTVRAVVVLLTLLVAGCVEPTPEPVQDAVGAVHGTVLDETLRPVAGANVTAGGNGTVTDGNGRFVLSGLPAARLVLNVTSPDHEPASVAVNVTAGAPREVNVTLRSLPRAPEPVTEVAQFRGFIQCDLMVSPTHSHENGDEHETTRCDEAPPFGDQQHVWDFPVKPDADGLVLELTWEPNNDLSRFLYVRIDGPAGLVGEVESPSPLRLQIADDKLAENVPDGGSLRMTALAGTGEDVGGGDQPVAWHFQQEFEAFASLFYDHEPSPTYSVVR